MLADFARVVGRAVVAVMLVLALAVLAVSLSPLIASRNPAQPTFIGAYSPMIVLGGSMEPTYHIGSILFVERAAPEAVRVGDTITFTSPNTDPGKPNTLTTHRVTAINKASGGLAFHTKGDANNAPDTWVVPASTVVGRGAFSVPYVGYASAFVRSRLGFLTLVILPGLLLIVMEIASIVRQVRRPRSTIPEGQAGAS